LPSLQVPQTVSEPWQKLLSHWLGNEQPAPAERLPPCRHGGVLMLRSSSLQGWLVICGMQSATAATVRFESALK